MWRPNWYDVFEEPSVNELKALTSRVRSGDPAAAAALRRDLEDAMLYMVRHALRGRRVRSALGRRVLAELAEADPTGQGHDPARREELIEQITRRLCDDVFQKLCGGADDDHPLTGAILASSSVRHKHDSLVEPAGVG
jgi:hypothetical protein